MTPTFPKRPNTLAPLSPVESYERSYACWVTSRLENESTASVADDPIEEHLAEALSFIIKRHKGSLGKQLHEDAAREISDKQQV